MPRPLVLASTSRYRADLFETLGVDFEIMAPDFDERALDGRFREMEPGEFALEIARGKARSIAADRPDALIVAGDQIVVVDRDGVPTLLHQPVTRDRAVEQLASIAGTTHQLINGLVVLDAATGDEQIAIDRHTITMRDYSREEASAYVDEYAPLDCVGAYRIEDDAGLIGSVEGEDRTGVIGLPLPALRRLLVAAGVELDD